MSQQATVIRPYKVKKTMNPSNSQESMFKNHGSTLSKRKVVPGLAQGKLN